MQGKPIRHLEFDSIAVAEIEDKENFENNLAQNVELARNIDLSQEESDTTGGYTTGGTETDENTKTTFSLSASDTSADLSEGEREPSSPQNHPSSTETVLHTHALGSQFNVAAQPFSPDECLECVRHSATVMTRKNNDAGNIAKEISDIHNLSIIEISEMFCPECGRNWG